MDYALPGISGLDALRKLTPDKFDPAVVLITAAGSEQVAVDAINNGAAGYVVKDSSLGFLSLLPIAIESGVAKQKLYKQISTLMNQATQNERKIAKLTAENEKLRVMNSTAQQKYFDTVHVH